MVGHGFSMVFQQGTRRNPRRQADLLGGEEAFAKARELAQRWAMPTGGIGELYIILY